MAHLREPLLRAAFWSTWSQAKGPIIVGLAGAATILLRFRDPALAPPLGRWLFWIAVALTPLAEPVLKIGFPYHLAVSLVGLCGLAALGWRSVSRLPRTARAATAAAFFAVSAWQIGPLVTNLDTLFRDRTLPNAAAFSMRDWPAASIAKSNYLMIADAAHRAAPPGGTLASSGAMVALYPLSGLRPSSYSLINLSDTLAALGMNPSALRAAIEACPPDVIVATGRTDIPGREAIEQAVKSMPDYSPFEEVATAPDRDYGGFAATIYARRREAPRITCASTTSRPAT
jgi:hypothetical protein